MSGEHDTGEPAGSPDRPNVPQMSLFGDEGDESG